MNDEHFIHRCFELARLGAGHVSPNPLVGAVLVHAGKIIGEGWHQQWGEAHAEVRCLASVLPENQSLIPHATLYCNLEPCSHFGKTPPCCDLILRQKIRRVVVSNTDPNPLVAGKGLATLRKASVEVLEDVLAADGKWLNRSFFTWILKKRPHIVLKWAQSSDGLLGKQGTRTAISGAEALRLVHRWRAHCDAILVGAQTAVLDNPRLDTRFFPGKNPLRVVLDPHGKTPATHHLLDDSIETWVFGKPALPGNFSQTTFIPSESKTELSELLEALKKANKAILLVEGGAKVLHQFLELGYWDEIRVLENRRILGNGIVAPKIPENTVLKEEYQLGADRVRIFAR
jgi:diaminohydroxyphosphoribosylaminopyrimidine deaminase/5-amino-6-(5-phosphoribosylamino)uracil reductase